LTSGLCDVSICLLFLPAQVDRRGGGGPGRHQRRPICDECDLNGEQGVKGRAAYLGVSTRTYRRDRLCGEEGVRRRHLWRVAGHEPNGRQEACAHVSTANVDRPPPPLPAPSCRLSSRLRNDARRARSAVGHPFGIQGELGCGLCAVALRVRLYAVRRVTRRRGLVSWAPWAEEGPKGWGGGPLGGMVHRRWSMGGVRLRAGRQPAKKR
jgi:hypothetical protein